MLTALSDAPPAVFAGVFGRVRTRDRGQIAPSFEVDSMKRFQVLLGVVASCSMGCAALAQDAKPAPKDQPKPAAKDQPKPASTPAKADAPKPAPKPAEPAAGADAMPTPEQMALMAPGAGHARLKALEGKWTFTGKFWMAEGAPPSDMTGSMDYAWVLDGRFLKESVRSEFDGRPFEGWGMMGYDNMTKQYQSTWCDNMSTGMLVFTGTYDEATKSITSRGEGSDPMSGGMAKVRSVMSLSDPNSIKYEHFESKGGAKEFKTMEIIYSRAK